MIDMREHFIQSNMIEDIFDEEEVPKSESAWEYLLNCETITGWNVLDIHSMVMVDLIDPIFVGIWRTYNVQISSSRNILPSYIHVPELMREWIREFQYYQDLDPREVHIKFERIHPFVDGNGRTGRLLMWWHEVKLGKKPTLIEYKTRHNYYDWFDRRSS